MCDFIDLNWFHKFVFLLQHTVMKQVFYMNQNLHIQRKQNNSILLSKSYISSFLFLSNDQTTFLQVLFFSISCLRVPENLIMIRGTNSNTQLTIIFRLLLKNRVKTNQQAVFESNVHLCKPQYKSTGVDELSISCINF